MRWQETPAERSVCIPLFRLLQSPSDVKPVPRRAAQKARALTWVQRQRCFAASQLLTPQRIPRNLAVAVGNVDDRAMP